MQRSRAAWIWGCRMHKNIEQMEELTGKPTGIGRIERGECPIGGKSPMACMFCQFGHMLDCHWPDTCEQARCGHYLSEQISPGY